MKITVYRAQDGWRWRAVNGEIVSESDEAFRTGRKRWRRRGGTDLRMPRSRSRNSRKVLLSQRCERFIGTLAG